jgi:hypothetical protein
MAIAAITAGINTMVAHTPDARPSGVLSCASKD